MSSSSVACTAGQVTARRACTTSCEQGCWSRSERLLKTTAAVRPKMPGCTILNRRSSLQSCTRSAGRARPRHLRQAGATEQPLNSLPNIRALSRDAARIHRKRCLEAKPTQTWMCRLTSEAGCPHLACPGARGRRRSPPPPPLHRLSLASSRGREGRRAHNGGLLSVFKPCLDCSVEGTARNQQHPPAISTI